MSDYRFNNIEKFTIWNSYGNRCFWCGEPISYNDTTIDHVLPEKLIDNPDELKRIKTNYKLQDDFEINDFCNWVPSHSNCNARKNKSIFINSPAFIFILDKLYSKSKNAKKYYEKLVKQQDKDKVIGQLLANLDLGRLSDIDLVELLRKTKSRYVWQFPDIDKDKLSFVPEGWQVMSENKHKHYITVTNGNIVATVPSDSDPDKTWFCYTCKNYGPWIGNKCVSCGSWGDLVE
jgi:hypothetical protein